MITALLAVLLCSATMAAMPIQTCDAEDAATEETRMEVSDFAMKTVETTNVLEPWEEDMHERNQKVEPVEEFIEEECVWYEEEDYGWTWYEEASDFYEPTGGLNAFDGVNYHNGNRETYYSSNVLYHYRTPEWTLGADGVYRDSDGYVVVASSDYVQGEVLDTSLGAAKVYDTGCPSGTVDVYVAW